MHITYMDAQNIVTEMKASIHRDINIMDENGIILASTNPAGGDSSTGERFKSFERSCRP